MTLVVHNTLSRRKEPLQPLRAGEVGMYVCGLTPYDDCHIGHLMGPVLFDAVARWLRARGYRVRFVNNITDVDDKIIARAAADGVPWREIAERYTAQYFELQRRLHVATITDRPRCTEFIPPMVAYVADLVARDRAYLAADGVYYQVEKQPGYGKLSGRRLDEMIAGARIERGSGLRHPADFCLWKLAKPGEPSWPSPWGDGRPGWHIECSVMSTALLGRAFDIHGGGDDLKFPHHENEIAQGEAHGDEYAHVWMHNGLIQYDSIKVGKSDPRMQDPAFKRQFVAKHLVDEHGAATIRFLLLSGHYRRPIDFAPRHIVEKRVALGKLHRQLGALIDDPGEPDAARLLASDVPRVRAFAEAMDDDFNTAAAVAELFALADEARKAAGDEGRRLLTALRDLGRLIGLFQVGDGRDTAEGAVADPALAAAMERVLALRQRARAARDFATSDRLRDQLAQLGIAVKDGKEGATWIAAAPPADAAGRLDALVADLASRTSAGG